VRSEEEEGEEIKDKGEERRKKVRNEKRGRRR